MIAIENFLDNLSGFDTYGEGYIEVVTDHFKTSRYFGYDKMNDAIQYASEKSRAGQEVFFGPAVRKEDLAPKRSDRLNILWTKCLWLDIDSPDKTLSAEGKLMAAEELKNNFLEFLKPYGLEPSYIVNSGHGFHIYFVLRRIHFDLAKWAQIQIALIRLAKADEQAKDVSRLLRIPGTLNCKDQNNPKPVEIVFESGRVYDEEAFAQLVKDHGRKEVSFNLTPDQGKPLGFIPPCIEHLLDAKTAVPLGHRHEVRMILAIFGHHEGWDVEDVIEKVRHFTNDTIQSEKDIRNTYKILQKDPAKYALGCGEGSHLRDLVDCGITACDKEKCQFGKPSAKIKDTTEDAPAPIFSAHFDGLIDLVIDDKGKTAFLVKENGQLLYKEKYQAGDLTYVPPPREYVQWCIPRGAEVIKHYTGDTDQAIFNDLVQYHHSISELPDDDHYKFLAAYDIHTHLADKCEYSPIIWFYAIPERGKTRTGKSILYVARRGMQLITVREPHLIRMAKDYKATLFIDISDLQQKMSSSGAEDILLNRYEQGATVARVLYPDRGAFADTVFYTIYGPTVVATNETVNETLSTRAIQIVMPQSNRRFENDLRNIDGQAYMERLVALRARWIDRDLPNVIKPCDGRLGDILRPIRQVVSFSCGEESWFLRFAEGVRARRRLSVSDTLDAQVVSAINDAQSKMKNGHILHEDILGNLNRERTERERISPHKLGRITHRLGFSKYTSGQQRGIVWNRALVNNLCERYGIVVVQTADFGSLFGENPADCI